MKLYYIGLATTFHDPALAIVDAEGEIVFAEAAERFLQNKRAINAEPDHLFRIADLVKEYCEQDAEFTIARSWSARASRLPFLAGVASRLGLLSPGWLARAPLDGWSRTLLMRRYQLYHLMLCVRSAHLKAGANLALVMRHRYGNRKLRFLNFDHHLTHAAYACYGSPFSEAVCMIVDGTGEQGSISCYVYRNGRLQRLSRHQGPESLGGLYMLITELCGFSSFGGEEWKVMGLAPYGRTDEDLYRLLRPMIRVAGCGLRYPPMRQLRAALRYLWGYRRTADASALAVADLAHTWQRVFSEIMDELLRNLYADTGVDNLVLSGGCALNSSYAGRVFESTPFKRLHIPSAPADDGNAVGAALLAYEKTAGPRKTQQQLFSPYLGSRMSAETLTNVARWSGLRTLRHLPETVHLEAARRLAEGRILGWIQERAEFGPRALGNRSILADPRPREMKDRLNREVKFREEFRPFAPAILHEYGEEYFENYQESPYMERTLRFKHEVRARVPAVVHVDGTGRLQTVKREWNARFHALIEAFHRLTNVPLLLNTSFNIMGKPMVHTVEDALAVFFTTGMDALVIEDYLLEK